MWGKVGLNALDEDLQGGADEAYRRLQQAGWVPRWLDATALARLPVRAMLPAKVTYSGHKTSRAQIDRHPVPEGEDPSGGGRYMLNEKSGDSIYVQNGYRNGQLSRVDTIAPKKSR